MLSGLVRQDYRDQPVSWFGCAKDCGQAFFRFFPSVTFAFSQHLKSMLSLLRECELEDQSGYVLSVSTGLETLVWTPSGLDPPIAGSRYVLSSALNNHGSFKGICGIDFLKPILLPSLLRGEIYRAITRITDLRSIVYRLYLVKLQALLVSKGTGTTFATDRVRTSSKWVRLEYPRLDLDAGVFQREIMT